MAGRTLGEREGGGRRGRALLIALGLALAAIALAAFAVGASGGSDGSDTDFAVAEGVEPLGDQRAGSAASLVDCDDWSAGSDERKRATVVDVRQQLTSGGTVAGRPSLSDQDAYDTFERACSNDFTGSFRLYKIYYDANAFESFDPTAYSDGG